MQWRRCFCKSLHVPARRPLPLSPHDQRHATAHVLLAAIPGSTTSKGLQLQLLRKNASGTYVVQNMGSSWTQAKTAANVTAPLDFAVRYIRTGALTRARSAAR
ncbi:hypothetical protein [Stenotrophomonas rhizophila]|uniref:Type 1 fimbria pilin n=1 Tax=Stenotrophomonas rhizophila TaxID=216778 RepID=A0AAW5PFD4_9GAMM|nr:hypothetical protein [Stenotrophomonas rhizophila]MCS4279169.1 type 1 fimbria pilin [Stenotrophomonas rhizophila]